MTGGLFDDDIFGDNFDFGLPGLDDAVFTDEFTEPQVKQLKLRSKPISATYDNALEFAKNVSLERDANTYAMLCGSFIFGDVFEALAESRGVRYKTFYVSTLGMSANNVDSLVNLIVDFNTPKVNLIVSNYFFGVEKHKLIKYIIEEIKGLPFQLAVAGSHFKIAAFETTDGKHFTVHGSANLSSNSNIEQIHIIEDRALYEFNKSLLDKIICEYGIIDETRNAELERARGATARKTWEVIRDGDT